MSLKKLDDQLCFEKNENKHVELYFGKFKEYGGQFEISKELFDELREIISGKYKIFRTIHKKSYIHNLMIHECIIHNDKTVKTHYYSKTNCKLFVSKNFFMIKSDKNTINSQSFPILSEYNNVMEQFINSYTINDVNLLFIKEKMANNKFIYYVTINFNSDKYDEMVVLNLSNIIISKLKNRIFDHVMQ